MQFPIEVLCKLYSDIFAKTKKQKEAVVPFHQLIEPRIEYLKATNNPPGEIWTQAWAPVRAVVIHFLHPSIVSIVSL